MARCIRLPVESMTRLRADPQPLSSQAGRPSLGEAACSDPLAGAQVLLCRGELPANDLHRTAAGYCRTLLSANLQVVRSVGLDHAFCRRTGRRSPGASSLTAWVGLESAASDTTADVMRSNPGSAPAAHRRLGL